MASVAHLHDTNKIDIHKSNITEEFFELKTKLAGDSTLVTLIGTLAKKARIRFAPNCKPFHFHVTIIMNTISFYGPFLSPEAVYFFVKFPIYISS